ncbi:MAG: hypothetical protein HY813_00270 [Candidatus Portnoybacteria bacterium]|nr:hypothetical protein [Candidatus Portnoybacteria bacterium]
MQDSLKISNGVNKKIVSVIFFIIIGAAVIYSGYVLFGHSLKNYYASWKIGRAYHKFERGFTDYLKNDTYGGATPEETYKLFVNTLKSGDIESASKYFYWEHQVQEQEKLQKMKDEGKLEEYIDGLPDWSKTEEDHSYSVSGTKQYVIISKSDEEETVKLPDGNGGFIEETFPPGEYVSFSVNFQLNERANIWKIYSL